MADSIAASGALVDYRFPAEKLTSLASSLGFSAWGVSRAERVGESAEKAMRDFVESGRNAGMDYLSRNLDKRFDPCALVPGCRSIVSVAMNYYPGDMKTEGKYTLSRYAYGSDYHLVVKHRLFELFRLISEETAKSSIKTEGRAFCDTAPVCERYWAWRSGLGFIGKNTLLIIPHNGSYFFLGELFLNILFDTYGTPMESRCGTCRRCLDACPGGALFAPYSLDSRRCLSYLTIENKGALPSDTGEKMGGCIYGCDRCQTACPHNRFASPTAVAELRPREELLRMTEKDWRELTYEKYLAIFRHSAVKRAKYEGLMRNIRAADSGKNDEEH